MDELSPLTRPNQSQVSINPTSQDTPSEGFNYPTFRQLNKQARVYISQPLNPNLSLSYSLFAIANTKGWFVALRTTSSGSELVISTLEDLRTNFKDAKPDTDELYAPKRTLPINLGPVNFLALSSTESRLFVGSQNGVIAAYDANVLFTPGSELVAPLKTVQLQGNPYRQILPNPGSEPNLNGLVAVVGEGKVYLFNGQLEGQGGWAATDLMSQPIAVSWSPKGKHLAIGLQTGDILTFALSNKNAPNKHIPPTADAILVSLNWLGPGHTFRTSYGANGENSAKQHIITLDTKTSTAVYAAPEHPFPSYDRPQQHSFVVHLPQWDEDSINPEANKALVVVGDISSVDLEVLAHGSNQWYRHVQDNPLSLPLDKNMDDAILLGLGIDLTDSSGAVPIMYAYLNDGSVQGWSMEHSKPYVGMITTGASDAQTISSAAQRDTDMGAEQTSQSASSGLFGQSTSSPFAQPSAFGQPAFGAAAAQPSSGFGQPGFGFGAFASSGPSAFGQAQQSSNTASTFGGAAQPAAGFSAFSGGNNTSSSSAFGGSTSNAFSNLSSTTSNVFGQGSFGSPSTNNNQPPAPSSNDSHMTREASMSDSTPSFGGFGLGSAAPLDPNKNVNSMFGALPAPSNSNPSVGSDSGSGLVKPGTGFGAFGNFNSNTSFEAKKDPNTPQMTPAAQPSSGFGQSGFSAFGKPGLGQPAFGKSAFGSPATPAATTAPAAGGFAAFANTNVSFGSPAPAKSAFESTTPAAAPTSGGFASFASSTPSPFGAGAATSDTSKSTTSTGGFSAFASATPTPFGTLDSNKASSGFTGFASTTPAFGTTPALGEAGKPATSNAFNAFSGKPSPFGVSEAPRPPPSPVDSETKSSGLSSGTASPFGLQPAKSPFGPASGVRGSVPGLSPPGSPTRESPASSPEPGHASPAATPPPSGGAFANIKTTPSTFKPASGFGAFSGSTPSDSPFFKKPETTPTTPVALFSGSPSTAPSDTTTPSKAPIFGSTSSLGAPKTVFGAPPPAATTPTIAPATGGFGAFSGSSTPFSAFATQQKTSFSDLLKIGDNDAKDPVKPSSQLSSPAIVKTESKSPSPFTPPPQPVPPQSSKSNPISQESSYGNISTSSASSSFVHVSGDEGQGSDEEDVPEDEYEDDEEEEEEEEDLSDLSEEEEGEEGEEEEDDDTATAVPASIPLPPSRSPSVTPQPEVPRFMFTPSPTEDSKASSERESSTTPPGTPAKEPNNLPGPSPSPTAPSPFSLGLGRPSTRPTRSSPLANTVASGDEFDEEERGKSGKGKLSESPKDETDTAPAAKRPKTPPLLSTLGAKPASVPTSPFLSPVPAPTPKSASAPPEESKGPAALPFSFGITKPKMETPSAPSIFSKPATPPVPPNGGLSSPGGLFGPSSSSQSAKPAPFGGFSMPTFSLKPGAATPPTPASPTPSLFGTPTPASKPPIFAQQPFAPAAINVPKTPNLSPFGMQAGTPQQTPSTFHPQSTPAPPSSMQSPPASTAASEPEGMQRECAVLVETLQKDLITLANMMQALKGLQYRSNISCGGSNDTAGLGVPEKWNLCDVPKFAEILALYQTDLDQISSQADTWKQSIRDVQNNMLKATTRREEIARFNKAKNDKDFTKMLRARTLGPEHSETQAQLRKHIRTIRDRVTKLEATLQENKRKLTSSNSGKPIVKAPTLDTINRTYRNIDAIIQQETNDITRLTNRIAKLEMKERPGSPSVAGSSAQHSRKPFNVTPNVAVTTAAALNAERSAHRLKKALLAVRKQPLLNTKAASSPKPPAILETPQKTFLGVAVDPSTPPPPIPDWGSLPDDNFSPGNSPLAHGRRGAGGQKKHTPSTKRNPAPATAPASTSAAPSFDWGPLPSFPVTTVSTPRNLPKSFVPLTGASTLPKR